MRIGIPNEGNAGLRMYLTAYPRFVPVLRYDLAIQQMIKKLRQQDAVLSIFQIGNINSPGISDIDMLVVFEDGAKCNLNPLEDLLKSERYLFCHGLYGVSETHFREARCDTFFHNYNLLLGEKLPVAEGDLSKEEMEASRSQTALEYLTKMFIDMTVEIIYGIVRVRVLLLHTKALLYDLEFLNISSGKLFDLIQTAVIWRDHWFKKKPDKQTLKIWIKEFYGELRVFLKVMLQAKTFYLPKWANLRIARNMTLIPSKKFGYTHKGMTLPAGLGGLGRKYFNAQHRFNKFEFQIPITTFDIPDTLLKRFIFMRNMKLENNRNLPYFMPLTSSLNILR